MGAFQKLIAAVGGDTWVTTDMLAIWPWPAVLVGAHRGQFTWDDYRCFTTLLQPGDFIITRSNPFLFSNAAIAHTAFKHLMVYVGAAYCVRDAKSGFLEGMRSRNGNAWRGGSAQERERVVVHAISEGVVAQDLGEALFHADAAAVVRYWKSPGDQTQIVAHAIKLLGREYDFEFHMNSESSLFCTELGWVCLEAAGIPVRPARTKMLVSLLGRQEDVPLADSFVLQPVAERVCCSVSALDRNFIATSATPNDLRDALRPMANARDGYVGTGTTGMYRKCDWQSAPDSGLEA